MTALEYALPLGSAIAACVGAYLSHCRAWDAKRSRDEAYDLCEQAQACERRVAKYAADVQGLHDCLKADAKPPESANWQEYFAWASRQPMTDPTPTISIPVEKNGAM